MGDSLVLNDLACTAIALLAFSAVVVAPGYVIAWIADLMEFRRRRQITRLVLAIPMSIALCPIVTYLFWRFAPPAVWGFYVVCAAGCAVLLWRERRAILSGPRTFQAIVAGWMLFATLLLIDMQIGNRLYFPTIAFDYSLRASVTASMTHYGVPVRDPLFYPGHPSVMRYHYFWFILCAVVQRITGSVITARHALIAGTIWCAIGLQAMVALYLRFFHSRGARAIESRTLFGIALLAVTGLDLIPVLFIEVWKQGVLADLEWWNEQVSAWLTTILWAPHQLAGLIACLMGFLLLWHGAQRETRERMIAAVAAGIMFSSAVGLTLHVTFAFAVFLVVWTIMEFASNHRREAAMLCLAGAVAATLSLPFLLELIAGGATGGRGFPIRFAVRTFLYFDAVLQLPQFAWKTDLANLAVLPLNYLLEFGFFLLVAMIQAYRMWRSRSDVTSDQICGMTMVLSCGLLCTFFSSAVGTANDLGWRGLLPVQFILLLWGAEMLADRRVESRLSRGDIRFVIASTLVLGVAGTLYAAIKVRFYPLLSDTTATPLYDWLTPDRELGLRTFAQRKLYQELRRRTPVGAVLQHNIHYVPQDIFHGIYADRQLAAEYVGCSTFAGNESAACWNIANPIHDLFDKPGAVDPGKIDEFCERYSINILIAKDTDATWHDRESWVWKRQPLIANDYGRAFVCGPSATK